MTSQATPFTRRVPLSERVIELLLFAAASIGVLTTVGIVAVLAFETFEFFLEVPPLDFFFGTRWSASIRPFAWGVVPLVTGTLLVAFIALVIAIPLGSSALGAMPRAAAAMSSPLRITAAAWGLTR